MSKEQDSLENLLAQMEAPAAQEEFSNGPE